MRKARHFISREKQVFLVGFSLAFPRFPQISKNRLNTSLISSFGGNLSKWIRKKNVEYYRILYQKCRNTKFKYSIKRQELVFIKQIFQSWLKINGNCLRWVPLCPKYSNEAKLQKDSSFGNGLQFPYNCHATMATVLYTNSTN